MTVAVLCLLSVVPPAPRPPRGWQEFMAVTQPPEVRIIPAWGVPCLSLTFHTKNAVGGTGAHFMVMRLNVASGQPGLCFGDVLLVMSAV